MKVKHNNVLGQCESQTFKSHIVEERDIQFFTFYIVGKRGVNDFYVTAVNVDCLFAFLHELNEGMEDLNYSFGRSPVTSYRKRELSREMLTDKFGVPNVRGKESSLDG